MCGPPAWAEGTPLRPENSPRRLTMAKYRADSSQIAVAFNQAYERANGPYIGADIGCRHNVYFASALDGSLPSVVRRGCISSVRRQVKMLHPRREDVVSTYRLTSRNSNDDNMEIVRQLLDR
jgi:hypothetical protein